MDVTLTDAVLFSTYFLLLFLAIFWLLVLLTGKETSPKKSLKNFPFFTAIVPAYNEEECIAGTLQSLVDLEYPSDRKEIIVVNDGSTDQTTALVEKFIQEHPTVAITLINQSNKGKGNALNTGLANARGEFYACLDADSFIAPNALQEMLPYFEDENVAAVCPLLKVKSPSSVLQKMQWVEYIINMLYKSLNARLDCVHVTPGPFSVYRTSIIRAIGGYDEKTITEDLEIAIRLQQHQYKIVQTFDAVVETVAPNTWKDLFRQRVRWYKGSVDCAVAYKKLMFNRKYGDFGYIRMPTIFLSGIIALVLGGTLLQDLGQKFFQTFQSWQAINFDLLTLLRHFTFNFNFLSLPFFKYFIALTLMGLSFFAMIYSYRLVQENIRHYGRTWVTLVGYLTVYALFISVVWVYIGYLSIAQKRNTWS
ncbi:glycosyltransferase family 2 protein [Candidatus Woesearchaeota archaeon]|nr:glycosyltransferase family 2 protein [Candidatus Woesearchaeota archaeon]